METWTLQIVGDIVKNAASALAQRDDKDPLALANNGQEIWRCYVPEVERTLLVLEAFEHGKVLAQQTESPHDSSGRTGVD